MQLLGANTTTEELIQEARALGPIIYRLRLAMAEDDKSALVERLRSIAQQKKAVDVADMIIAELTDAEVRALAASYGVQP